jgi:competence protein ComFC
MFKPEKMNRPAYRLYRWAWSSLDWLFPPKCGGCGASGSRWCEECQRKATLIQTPICLRCGLPLHSQSSSQGCPKCRTHPLRVEALRSWAVFAGPIRNALHRLKYKGDIAMGEILARPLISMLQEQTWPIDLVTPVPLSIARRSQRGYNQASLLSIPLAFALGFEHRPGVLAKIKDTRSQVGLSYEERRTNVAGSFSAVGKDVAGKNILVVDDVTTSGATLDACAGALKQAGAQVVYAITLARAI